MKSIEETLPSTQFIRIHKSYIASIKAIGAIEGNQLIIAGKKLPISRDKKSEILEKLVKNQ
jgi:DNA-binding LytR/AlgR family response regulator